MSQCVSCGGEFQKAHRGDSHYKCDQCGDLMLCSCGGVYVSNGHCGALVCEECGNHCGLARCYCGWSADGSDGREELIEMGECIDGDY